MNVLVVCSTKKGGAHWMSSVVADCLDALDYDSAIFFSPSSRDQSWIWRVAITAEVYILEVISKALRYAITKEKYYFFNFGLSSIVATLWLLLHLNRFDTIVIFWRSYFVGNFALKIMAKLGKKLVFYHTDHAALTGGCHFQSDCANARRGCVKCPAILRPFRFIPAINQRGNRGIASAVTSISPNERFVCEIDKSGVIFKDQFIRYFPVSDVYYTRRSRRRPRNRLVFVASTIDDSRKGLQLLVSCLREYRLHLLHFGLELCFVGKGSRTNNAIRNLVESYNVECYEYLSPAELAALYADAFAIVNVPLQDMGPSTVFEGLCSGLLVISSDVGIGPELIAKSGAGAVMEKYDEATLFKSLVAVLEMTDETYFEKLRQIDDFIPLFSNSNFAQALMASFENSHA